MNHCFNLGIANKFDTNVAIFLQSIAHWTHNNLTNKRNLIDGHCWTYNSLEALGETFTYWSKKQLETVIKNSLKSGLLIKGNHNKHKYDRTCWYALSYEAYEFFPELRQEHFLHRLYDSIEDESKPHFPNWRNGKSEFGTPIPITNSNTKNTNNSEFDNSPAAVTPKKPKPQKQSSGEALAFLMALINVYREVFPDNPQPHKRVIATSLQRTLSTLVKRWPELDPDGLPLTVEVFKQYLTELRNTAPKFALGEYITEQGNRKEK